MSSAIPHISLVYIDTSKQILLFSYSFHVPCIILSNDFFHIIRPMFSFLFNLSQSEVLLIKWVIFFWSSKTFFWFFKLFENGHVHNVVSTLIHVIILEFLTLSSVGNVNVEIDNVDLTLFSVGCFNVDIHKVISTLIWHWPTSWRHISQTTTLRPR